VVRASRAAEMHGLYLALLTRGPGAVQLHVLEAGLGPVQAWPFSALFNTMINGFSLVAAGGQGAA
jgi:hypothetical protein